MGLFDTVTYKLETY